MKLLCTGGRLLRLDLVHYRICTAGLSRLAVSENGQRLGLNGPGKTTCSGCERQQTLALASKFPRYSYIGNMIGRQQLVKAMSAGHQFVRGDYYVNPLLSASEASLTDIAYHHIADETLQSLAGLFEDLRDADVCPKDYSISHLAGILTVHLGANKGTYVINKLMHNKQLWLSSTNSGIRRYEFVNGRWMCKSTNIALHDLLTMEVSAALGKQVDFSQCSFGKLVRPGDL